MPARSQVERDKVKAFIVALFRVSGEARLSRAQIGKAYCWANIEALRGMHRPVCLWPAVKLPDGPGVDDYKAILPEMVDAAWLRDVGAPCYGLGASAPPQILLDEEELSFIQAGWGHVKDKGYGDLRTDTHVLASYSEAEMGAEMLLELDALDAICEGVELRRDIPNEKWVEWERQGLAER